MHSLRSLPNFVLSLDPYYSFYVKKIPLTSVLGCFVFHLHNFFSDKFIQPHSFNQDPSPGSSQISLSLSLSLSLLLTSLPFSTPLPLLFTRLLHLALLLHLQCNMFKRKLIFSPKPTAYLAFCDSVNCSSILSLTEAGIHAISD